MFNIRSYYSFPGNGRKFETEKDLFFFLSTCCAPKKFYLSGTFFEVNQQLTDQKLDAIYGFKPATCVFRNEHCGEELVFIVEHSTL